MQKNIYELNHLLIIFKTFMYELAAELTIIVHFLFIVFVVIGSLLCLIKTKLLIVHLFSVAWGVYIELSGQICPLTYLENWFLKKAGLIGYNEGFVSKYIFKLVYPSGLNEQIQILLAIALILVNIFLYSIIFFLKKR